MKDQEKIQVAVAAKRKERVVSALLGFLAIGLLAGCGGHEESADAPAQTAMQRPAPNVEIMEVMVTDAPSTRVLTGRARAFQEAEIRPQVTGLVQKRLFTEGQQVEEGEALYIIDPSEYRAAVQSAQAALEGAEASAAAARETTSRFQSLAEINAVSKQDYDNAVANLRQAESQIGIRKAAVDQARINLARTTVRSPISGQIGRSSVTPGALVTANQATALARVLQLDPIYVDLTAASTEVLKWKRDVAAGLLQTDDSAAVPVTIRLEDGELYAEKGALEFSEVSVDENAGTVIIRAIVPNPDGLLLPGMFVKAEFSAGSLDEVVIVPQKAVQRTPKGEAMVLVVNDEGIAEQRILTVEGTQGANWVVRKGLSKGERIITSGMQSVRPGMKVSVVPTESGFANLNGTAPVGGAASQ